DLQRPIRLEDYNRATYEKLHTEGRRLPEHPLGRAWPRRFEGTWKEFVAFDKEVDVRGTLAKANNMAVSKWNNAAIQQRFLPYNCRPKTEWPDRTSVPSTLAAQIDRRVGASSDRSADAAEWTAIRRMAGGTTNAAPARVSDGRVADNLPPASLFKP